MASNSQEDQSVVLSRVLGSLEAPQNAEALLGVNGIGCTTEPGAQIVREGKGLAADFVTVELPSFIVLKIVSLCRAGRVD